MLSLQRLLAALVLCLVLASLPSATQCDTSYYEKYYAARRFLPQKRAALLDFEFSVKLVGESLDSYERVALVGDVPQLGAWRANGAILLNRTDEHNVWSGVVPLAANASLNYRYFIAAVHEETGALQIRRWESHITARVYDIGAQGGNGTLDTFGWIDAAQREVQRGWLHSGHVVQFKLFRNPLQINEIRAGNEQLRLKLQPIEPHMLTPILPSARAHTEYVRMQYGNSWLRAQPEYGVPYGSGDILIFETTLAQLHGVAYLLKLYAMQEGGELVRLIGYQYIYPDVLLGSEGNFTLKLLSPVWLHAIGTLDLQYLVIAPSPNAAVDFRSTFMDYWRANWTGFDMGHRGLGRSLHQATNAPALIENTLASMKASTELGTDFVEFDVQLTSDLVPIIYHNFEIYVCMDPKTPTSMDDLTEVHIKDVTYEQLKNLKTYQVVGSKVIEYPAHNTVEQEDYRLFPLFEDFLTQLNKTVGFDIEVKWPQLQSSGSYERMQQTIDKNVYVDRILEVMQRHGCGRFTFFTSFDADICTMLRYKQNMYPVMYLFSSTESYYADPRSDTIYDIVNNAQAFDLAGVVPNALFIQQDPGWIEVARKQQKHMVLWGDVLKDATSIAWFKEQGAAGVIYDRLDLWLPLNKQNAFELEDDLPEFFQLQCTALEGAAPNTTIAFL